MENSNQNQDKKKTNKRKFFIFKKYENFDWNIKRERERERRIVDSFNYAIEGTIEAIRNEKHMKVHVLLAALIMIAAILTNASRVEIMILSLTSAFVMITELINTSVEAIVDLISPQRHVLAKLAKDVAAGAVLISAINAICVAYLIFYDKALLLFSRNIQVTRIAGRTGNIVVLILALTALIVITIKAFYKKGTPLEGGMPSGHSAIAFSIFAMILFITPDIRIVSLALFMAFLVAQSRVKSEIHSIKEVIIGGLIGFLIAFIIMGIVVHFGVLYN